MRAGLILRLLLAAAVFAAESTNMTNVIIHADRSSQSVSEHYEPSEGLPGWVGDCVGLTGCQSGPLQNGIISVKTCLQVSGTGGTRRKRR